MTVCSRQAELCRSREQRGEFSWSSGQEVEARELHRKGDTMESKYVNVVIGVFGVRFLHFLLR